MAMLGMTDAKIAEEMGVNRATIARWKEKYKEFCDALKKGKETPDDAVQSALFQRAVGYTHPEDKIFQYEGEPIIVPTVKHYPPDVTACIFWLKNRKPEMWRDKREFEGEVFVLKAPEIKKPDDTGVSK